MQSPYPAPFYTPQPMHPGSPPLGMNGGYSLDGAYSLDASPTVSPFGNHPQQGVGQRPPQHGQRPSNGGYHAPNGSLHGLLGDLRVS